MSSTRPWEVDAEARGSGWHDGPVAEKLRIGIWEGDNQGEYRVTSPIRRCLQSAAETLGKTHHEVIDVIDFPPVHQALALAAHYFQLDDRETLKGVLREGCEDPIPALKNAAPESVFRVGKCGLTDVWDCNTRLEEYRESVAEIWRKHKLDVLICPPATTVASPHDFMPMPAYTVLWNLLDVSDYLLE
jgi:Asp-tRNA(Asn)/Glu-tRNA(Gln) amidotransferase A subunit family amidase